MRPTPFVTRTLCLALAIAMGVPSPALLLAQDRAGEPPPALGVEDTILDLRSVDALDLDPETGQLVLAREDLALGEGAGGLTLVRTYHPWSGDQANFGTHWASLFDVHLDVHPSRGHAAFVAEDGHRTYFLPGEGGVLRAITGHPATIEVLADGYVVTGLGDERTWRFDGDGFPVSRTQDGQGLTFQYDGDKRLASVKGAWGVLEVERDSRGVIAALITPGKQRVTYVRDELGNLASVRAGTGLVERYGWDPAGRLVGVADDAARIAWDAVGRVVAIDGRALRPITARYVQTGGGTDADAGAVQVQVDRRGERFTMIVSADGRRLRRTGERGEVETTQKDERDRLVRRTVTAGETTLTWTQTFDAQGRLVEQASPAGTTKLAYATPRAVKPSKVTLPDGRVTTFGYDAQGRLVQSVAPGGATLRWTYDAQGRVATTTDARGAVTKLTYDERGLVVQTDVDLEGTTKLLRDADGRVMKVRRPDGRLVEVDRDAAGRATRVSDPHGVFFSAAWDARGRLLRMQDELGRTYRYTWDARGDLARVEDEEGLLLALEHDLQGRLTRTTDALGNQTTFERPDPSTVVVTDPTAGKRVVKTDALGRLVEETRGGATLRYGWDSKGHLTSRTTPRGTDTFSWDEAGRMVGMKGPDGGYALGWDDAGRLASLTDTTLGKGVEYAYTPAGDRAATKTPWGTTRYRHDAQGRVVGIDLQDGGSIAIDLGPDGKRREVRYPNGVATRFTWQKGRLAEVVTAKGDEVIDRKAYEYDASGRVASVTDKAGKRTSYLHDGRGRLVEQKGPEGRVTWSWDAAGNRISETRAGVETRAEVSPGNRLSRVGETALAWDEAGQLVEQKGPAGTTTYGYDHDGHLTSARLPTGETVRYGYAPNGTRLWREDGKGRTTFVNDLADVVGEVGTNGELQTGFVHGPGVDDVLAATRGGERFFYHHDQLGSVTAMTGKDGAVAARFGYDAFGQQTLAEGAAAAWNPWRFTGRSLDQATGLYDLRARSYSAALGRFTSPDPLGVLGGLNLYAYADGAPTTFTDPFGLKPWYERLWEGTKDVASGVSSWASGLTWSDVGDGLKYVGRQSWAFTRGFGKGLWNAGKGIVNAVLHPVETVNGIIYAVEHWDETKEAFKALWEEYKDAAMNDPEKFAEMTGMLTAEVLVSVVGTKGLDKVAKARVIAAAATRVATTARVVGSPVTRLATRTGTTLATRFPRVASTVRRASVVDRARRIEAIRRAARTGNVFTRAGRRVVDTGRDIGRATRYAVRQPGPFVVSSGRALSRAGVNLVSATARGTWTATKRFGIPVILAFNDQITDAINRTGTHEAAMGAVTAEGERLLADAARLNGADMAARVDAVGRVYRDYRNRLLAGVNAEDLRLKAELDALNAAVERGEIPDNTVDARLNALLEEYGRRRHNLMVDLYERNRDVEHDMLHPSPNRTISFQDEIDLLKAALERATDPEARLVLEARLADLEALMAHEYELFRSGEHDALIAGIAGPPRDADQPTPPPVTEPSPTIPTADPDPTADPFGDELPADTLDGLVDPGDNQ